MVRVLDKKKINSLIANGRSSIKDLQKLLNQLNIPNFKIIRKHELTKAIYDGYQNIIMNLDDIGSGTHWVALNTVKNRYFDSFGQPPPMVVPKRFKDKKDFEIQGINREYCGQYCALWLFCINHANEDYFYKLFKDII